MILQVLTFPHEALKTKCTEWQFVAPLDVVEEVEKNLVETMLAYNGIGLAANQVGILERLVAIQRQDTGECFVMFNPEIMNTVDDVRVTADEGCLSFPRVRLAIERYSTIKVKYQNRHGNVFEEQFSGIDAICLQHEIDHLNGIVFKDHVSELKYQRALKRAK